MKTLANKPKNQTVDLPAVSKKPSQSLVSFVSAGLLAFSFCATLTLATEAQACRDCPFPMKVADGHWMMPNGRVEFFIDETKIDTKTNQMIVRLVDPVTGRLLATGTSKIRNGRKNLIINLRDSQGEIIKGQFYFVDGQREQIKARFTCASCNISELIQ